MEFRKKFKELRKKMKMTQKKLSEETKIPIRTIENWEAGKREPQEYVQILIIDKLKEILKMEKTLNMYLCEQLKRDFDGTKEDATEKINWYMLANQDSELTKWLNYGVSWCEDEEGKGNCRKCPNWEECEVTQDQLKELDLW